MGACPADWRPTRLKTTVRWCQNGLWGDEPDGIHDLICIRVADFDRVKRLARFDQPTYRAYPTAVRKGRLLERGDLLIEKSGGGERQPVGTVVVFDSDTAAMCSNFVARMPIQRDCDARFLCYLHEVLYHLGVPGRSVKQTTGIQNLDADAYLNERIELPPLKEQQAIASFLDRKTAAIDELVTGKERLVDALRDRLLALVSSAVGRGLAPKGPTRESGSERLGRIPKHWTAIPLGYVARIFNGSTPSREEPEYWYEGSIPWLTSAKVHEGEVTAADQFVTSRAFRECHLPMVSTGSVLVAITGEGKTRGTAARLTFPATISQHIAAVTPSSRLTSEYLWRYVSTLYEWLRYESSGGGSTKAAITCEFLKGILVPLPPPDEQVEICTHINRIEARDAGIIARTRKQIDLLREYRQAVVSAAVTGKIDVSSMEAA